MSGQLLTDVEFGVCDPFRRRQNVPPLQPIDNH